MDIVSTGVAISPSVEVWQSAQGALEVVLMDTVGVDEATSQDHAVCHLYRTRCPVNVMIMTPPHNNATVLYLCTYIVSYSRLKDGEELLLVSVRSSVVQALLDTPPISRRPAGDLQLT